MRHPERLAAVACAVALAGAAWSGEAPVIDAAKAQQAIAAAVAAKDGGLPAWVADPTLNGVLPEAACGIGEDAGIAVMAGLLDLARMRETRVALATRPGAAAAPSESMDRSTTAVSFGPIKVQAIFKQYVREEGEITSTATSTAVITVSEATERIAGPLFTCKHWFRDTDEAGKADKASTSWLWEWDAAAPVTGAQVVASLAEQGVMVAALAPLDEHGAVAAWMLALPSDSVKPAGSDHLLPYQALAVAIVGVLQRTGAGVLPDAVVTRPTAGVFEVAWPQADANLTIRMDAAGRVVGVTARQKANNLTRPLAACAKASLTAAAAR